LVTWSLFNRHCFSSLNQQSIFRQVESKTQQSPPSTLTRDQEIRAASI
jgi:hypothetical protein